ncbi:MAG: class I SAM-dependent methyltransferase [Cytophagaceae bacterium]|jgi:hypothetical protein|nr:class I SAM-dependent methyltransferase [Cytophagaceae bacterium]
MIRSNSTINLVTLREFKRIDTDRLSLSEEIFIPPDHPDIPPVRKEEVSALALRWKGKLPDAILERFLRQTLGLSKTQHKLPTWNAQGVAFPPRLALEQCSSEKTASFKAGLVHGKKYADLSGGMGVDCWALGASFERGFYVEQDAVLCQHARYNFNQLGRNNIQVLNQTAEEFLEQLDEKLDLLYLDPARRLHSQKVFQLSDCSPRLDLLWPLLLEKSHQLLVKLSPLVDIKNIRRSLPSPLDVYVISSEQECKEVLLRYPSDQPSISAVLLQDQERIFRFTEEEESLATPRFAAPMRYLYEPDVALLKAGPYQLLCTWFDVFKMGSHSHLYTSEILQSDFPGRTFEVVAVHTFSPKKIKKEKRWTKANIAVRNFPLEVAEIRKQCQIADGGDTYLFATTLLNEELVLIECKKNGL